MASPVYRLAKNLPLVWTSATSIQVGVDPPRARVDNIPDNAAPLLHALSQGTPASGLAMLARVHHVHQAWVDHLVASLRPAFGDTATAPPLRVQVWSTSEAVTGLMRLAQLCGVEVAAPGAVDANAVPSNTVVLLVADYLTHPRWADQLLGAGVTHCPVVFSDQTVSVGPVVTPGDTPCLVCVESHRRDHTPGWLEVSSQIWGKQSPLHTPDNVGMAWALLLLLMTPGSLGDLPPGFSRAVFRADVRSVSWQPVDFHPLCTCRGLDTPEGVGLTPGGL